MSTVSVTEMTTENYTENVAYTETVQVAAAGCGEAVASMSYAAPCAAASTCGSARGGMLKGLFGKLRGGCGASKGCN